MSTRTPSGRDQSDLTAAVLTHGSSGGRVKAALAEGAQQGGLAHAGVADQDDLEEAVRRE